MILYFFIFKFVEKEEIYGNNNKKGSFKKRNSLFAEITL